MGGGFSPDGETIVVTYVTLENDSVQSVPNGVPDLQIFDLATMSSILGVDTEHPWDYVFYSRDGERLALTFDREVRLLDASDSAEIWTSSVSGVAGRPVFLDGDELLVPVEASGFTILSAADGSSVDHIDAAELNAAIIATNQLRTHIAYRAGDHVRVLEIATGEIIYDQTHHLFWPSP